MEQLEQPHYRKRAPEHMDSKPEQVDPKPPEVSPSTEKQLILEDAKRQLLSVLHDAQYDQVENPLTLGRRTWIERSGIPDNRVAAKAVAQLVKDGNAMAATIEYRIYAPATPDGTASIMRLGTHGTHTLDRARTWRWVLGLGFFLLFFITANLETAADPRSSGTPLDEWGVRETSLVLLGVATGGYMAYLAWALSHPITNQIQRLHGALRDRFKAVVKRVTIALVVAAFATYIVVGLASSYLDIAEAIQLALAIFIPVATGVGYLAFELGKKN